MRRLSIAAALAATMSPVGSQPLAQCPMDTLMVCGVTTTSSAPTASVLGCFYNASGASYDLRAGEVAAGAGEPASEAVLTTRDIFVLTGPSSGAPVSFSAEFTVRGGTTFRGTVAAEVSGGGGAQGKSLGCSGCFSLSFAETLSLPLTVAVGSPFTLRLFLRALSPTLSRVESRARVTGNLGFALPPGYAVTSCQGYTTAPTTAAPAWTWGRLKAIYR